MFGLLRDGYNRKVYLIAEIGINHSGDVQIAKKLIDAAFATGWDCVKFQKRTPEVCVPESQKNMLKSTPWGEMTYLEYKKKIEFGQEEFDYIDEYCKLKPIDWTASVWDLQSVDFLMKYNVPFIKIPSAHLTNDDLLTRVVRTGKPIVASTGMSTVNEIDHAVEILKGSDFMLMHTNSAYPTPPEDLNLRTITFLNDRYDCPVGYSGHEYGLDPTVMAVVLGAKVVERHITLDHKMWGTDQAASLEVHAMDMLRKRIREVELCLGNGVKTVAESERPIREKLRGG